jgi:hypothetical protein
MNGEHDDFTFSVRTRSDDEGDCYFPTIREALDSAEKNTTIYKVSFMMLNGEMIRLIRKDPSFWDYLLFWREHETEWVYSPI